MSRAQSPFRLVRHPLRARRVHVVNAEALSPKMRRLTVQGDDLSDFVSLAPEDHVRIFFPVPGRLEPVLPTVQEGRVTNPSGGPIHGRDYTPLNFDTESRSLQVDFFLHGHGVAARWAAGACLGDRLGLAGPRGSFLFEAACARHVFVGDETASPEFFLRMATLPPGVRRDAVVVVDDSEEQQPAGPEVLWVHRRAADDVTASLLRKVDDLAPFSSDTFFWLAGEATQTRAVLRHLVTAYQVDSSQLRSSGHWKRGVSDHDHHTPLEAA